MRNIDVALDLMAAGIAVAGVDQAGIVKSQATTDRRALCSTFRDSKLIPAAVGKGLLTLCFHGDAPYRLTVENLRAKNGSIFDQLAVLRSPSGRWLVPFRVKGEGAPAGEVLARDKSGSPLVEVLAEGHLLLFGGSDAPVWRRGDAKTIPVLPAPVLGILLASAREVNEAPNVSPGLIPGDSVNSKALPVEVTTTEAQRGDFSALAEFQSPAGFLELLWHGVSDGWVTFFAKGAAGKPVTAAFPVAKLAESQQWALAQAKNSNVWHGVGLRKHKPAKNERGTTKDVGALPGLWFDLDVKGPGHAEQELPDTFEDALDFLASLPLKPTLTVFTGGGLQPYWLFPEPLRLSTEADWNRVKSLSERWQRFIIARGRKRGWKLDNTSDLPRVLRLPGTYNRKTDKAVLVTVPAEYVNLAARYDLNAFEAVLPPVETPRTAHVQVDGHEDRDEVADADADLIDKKCLWFSHCRIDAAMLNEPQWYAFLSILIRCKDGYRLAHEWSKGHPKYTPAETDAKLRQAKDKAGPRTCDSIHADFGTYCVGCSLKVKSPIVLGRVDRLPDGFQVRENGIFYRVEDSQGNISWEWVCSPLRVLALTRNGEGREWGRLIEVVDPDGQAHRWAMPMEALAGSGEECRRELLSMGLRLAPGKGAARLHILLSLCRPFSRARCVSRTGWHDRLFVLPDAVFGQAYGEQVILQVERAENPFTSAGTLPDWQEHIGRFCLGNSRLVLSVSAALAAPLLQMAGGESGGLHFVGGSSQGKTTALVVAGSVCGGGGVRGYIRQWRATANGLESIAAAHCDALLCLDELAQVAAKEAAEVAYMLGNGTGKTRANKTGGARKPAEWRLIFISTGEVTLADKVREDGRGRVTAGQAVRVVDIEADAGTGLGLFEDLHGFPDGDAFARHLKESASRFYGTPLRAFLEKLTSDFDEAARVVPELIKTFTADHCPIGADGQVRRVCNRFALVAAGGECGAAYGVLPWPKGEATRAAVRCFQDWLAVRGGTGAAEVQSGLAQVRAFFQAHGASRFETWGNQADESKTINRAGFRRKEDLTGAWEYFVPATVFKSEIARGHDTKRLVKELVERGLIITGKDGKPASLHKIPGQPQAARYYRFAPEVVLDDQADEACRGLSKNRVTTVTRVTDLESQPFPGNPTEKPRVTRVTTSDALTESEPGNPLQVTQVTQPQNGGLPKKYSNIEEVTRVTQVTAENDNPEQKSDSRIDMKPAEGTALWTGPAELDLES